MTPNLLLKLTRYSARLRGRHGSNVERQRWGDKSRRSDSRNRSKAVSAGGSGFLEMSLSPRTLATAAIPATQSGIFAVDQSQESQQSQGSRGCGGDHHLGFRGSGHPTSTGFTSTNLLLPSSTSRTRRRSASVARAVFMSFASRTGDGPHR